MVRIIAFFFSFFLSISLFFFDFLVDSRREGGVDLSFSSSLFSSENNNKRENVIIDYFIRSLSIVVFAFLPDHSVPFILGFSSMQTASIPSKKICIITGANTGRRIIYALALSLFLSLSPSLCLCLSLFLFFSLSPLSCLVFCV